MIIKRNHKQESWKRQAETIIRNFKKRGIDGKYFDTCTEAVQEISRMIQAGSLVSEALGY